MFYLTNSNQFHNEIKFIKGNGIMEKIIGVLIYFSLLMLFTLYIGLSNSIAAENEALDPGITWQFHSISTSVNTETFTITEYGDELNLDKINQHMTANTKRTEPKMEYRLYKLDYNGSFTDTGIYNILEGSKCISKSTGNLHGSISPGTYKIRITNLNGENSTVYSDRIINEKAEPPIALACF